MVPRLPLLKLVALTALIVFAGEARTQETAGPESADAMEAGTAAAPSVFPWDTIGVGWIESRFKIEAVRFKVRDETGVDWPGSDEVMVKTVDADGWTVSHEIKNMDSGDTHTFNAGASCIVGVNPGVVVLGETSVCHAAGEPPPFGFEVEMWEKDAYGWPPGFCVPQQPAAMQVRTAPTTTAATTLSAEPKSSFRPRSLKPRCRTSGAPI
jgi:hypothetical protein